MCKSQDFSFNDRERMKCSKCGKPHRTHHNPRASGDCLVCNGSGRYVSRSCPTCDGKGWVTGFFSGDPKRCGRCDGSGFVERGDTYTCGACHGTGRGNVRMFCDDCNYELCTC